MWPGWMWGDAFDLSYATGTSEPSAFRTVTLDPAGEALELGVLASSSDLFWLRLADWGSNLMTVEADALSKDKDLFSGTGDAVTGLTRLYPGFAVQMKSAPISGDPSYELTLRGAGGYTFSAIYTLNLLVKGYTERFTTSRISGAQMTAVSLDLPSAVNGEIPTSLDAATLESVSDKYLPLVSNPFAAVSVRMAPSGTPTTTPWVQPMLVNWEISRAMLERTMTSVDVTTFLEDLAESSEKLATFFAQVRPYKHFPSQAVDLLTLADEAGNRGAFFSVASDPTAGKITLTFRLLLSDSDTPEATAVLEDGIGYFLVSDGTQDGVLEDPLCLAPRPGSVTPHRGRRRRGLRRRLQRRDHRLGSAAGPAPALAAAPGLEKTGEEVPSRIMVGAGPNGPAPILSSLGRRPRS